MATVRELIANLGFKIDTTGATRFDSAVNRSKKNLEGLNTVSLAGLVTTATKAFAIVTTVATAGSLAAAKKFADIQTSWEALQQATKEGFAPLKKEIESILQDKVLKNLIDEIDLVNAALAEAQEKGVKGQTLADFLRPAALLAVQAKKPLSEVLGLITGFAVEGDLGIFKLLRELPPALQELYKVAGISPAQAGFIGRGEKVRESLRKVEAELEKNIIKQREEGLLTFRELGGAFEKLTIEIGKNILPTFKKLNDIIIPIVEKLTLFTGVEVGPEKKGFGRIVLEALFPLLAEKRKPQEILKSDAEDIWEAFKKFIIVDPNRPFNLAPVQREHISVISPGTLTNQTSNTPSPNINITVPITIESGASADPVAIEQAVNTGIRRAMGSVLEQSNAQKLIRGGE